jgi:LuxR family maltose regulon positive regulatory protein
MGSVIEIQMLRALALHVLGDTAQALEALERALSLARLEGYVRIFVDEGEPMTVLLSTFLRTRSGAGRQDPQRRALVDYARQLSAVSGAQGSTGPPAQVPYDLDIARPLLEPLTGRELEVLRLVAAGFSNREIAAELVVAVSTVKWYINILFSKLEVKSRTLAVARARSLRLIAP